MTQATLPCVAGCRIICRACPRLWQHRRCSMRFTRVSLVAAGAIAGAPLATLSAQSSPSPVTFTREQADAGGRVYARACANCHGARLDDGVADPLAGAAF